MQQVRCVLELIRHGSFTKAAQKLYISQPHLSQQVQKLERELGVTLFTRTTHSLVPTEAGIEFCRCAKEVIDAWDKLEACCSVMASTLTIGILDRFKTINLPSLINQFHSQYPNINIKINNFLENDLPKPFDFDRLDIVFLRGTMLELYINNPDVKCNMFFSENVCVLMSQTNPLAIHEIIRVEQLKGFKIVAGQKGSTTYDLICKVLDIKNTEEHFAPVFTDSHDIMAELISEGNLITFGNKSVGDYYGLVSVPLSPTYQNDAYMVYPVKKRNSAALAAFISFITDAYSGQSWKINAPHLQKNQ
jgi:LysR family cyn operon transcriptional activator